jgi:tetratricopeptide (TPR) repeat protein
MNARASSSSAAENSAAPGVVVGVGSVPRYRVFLSYSHADTGWARWLMRRLEGFHVPERFHGRAAPIGEVGARIAPVFRDRDELPTTSDLGETIRTALRQSATLVVICSPASAKSRWVQAELLEFKRLGGSARVFAFIVGGEPKAEETDDDCFSPALRHELGADGELSAALAEVVAADARSQGDGREDAFIRLVAGLLGVGFDDLRQREHARRHRRMIWITAASVAGMAITLGLALFALKARNDALVARNDAQRRQERGEKMMADMLNDMKAGLQKADKLDALDETGAKLMGYFSSLDPRDLTDTTLTQQAKALTQIGQMRIAQLRYPEASAAFTEALARSAALVERHPENADMLFERAQAEYWIGFVHYKHGDLAPASQWMTRYRDSAVALAKLEPGSLRGQKEASSGHHNLAVLELERGNLAAARSGFLGELAVREKMAAENPKDTQLQFSVANFISYLGTVAEREGDLAEAVARYGEQIARLEALVAAEPKTPHWRRRLTDALGFQASVMAISGQRAEALKRRQQARDILEALVALDPANREWQFALCNARARDALLRRAEGDAPAAERIISECRPILEKLAGDKAADRFTKGALALAWRIEAQLHDAAGRQSAAAGAAVQAVTLGKLLVDNQQPNDSDLGEYTMACVVAGVIAQRAGDTVVARRHWQTALDTVESRARESNHWRLLDPVARVLSLLGRGEDAAAIIARLRKFGYEPLEPWPNSMQ